ncbi:hypothetical protein QEJ61_gp14 [Curtobacterium phage Pize]|uniref:hypothetical protein n=1 Tax=Curtobacterium phage Pize TaxID=2851068 RepID=UPI0021FDF30D|nr:hypothetical protein QEJ61_gp14 [Curtobacterium phage Pize]QXG07746.1 hypothetical protein [Curtobacterium phage Pize]
MGLPESFLNRLLDDPILRWVVIIVLILCAILGVAIFAYRVSGKISLALENLFVVRRQVENDHKGKPNVPENMREEITGNHEDMMATLNRVAKLTLINAEGIATINNNVSELTGRVSEIEDTQRAETMQALREELKNHG